MANAVMRNVGMSRSLAYKVAKVANNTDSKTRKKFNLSLKTPSSCIPC